MISGEAVSYRLPAYATDELGNRSAAFGDPVEVPGVVVGFDSPQAVSDDHRPLGYTQAVQCYFPKGFDADLRGARLVVRGVEYDVTAMHPAYTEANVPGRFNAWCEGARSDG